MDKHRQAVQYYTRALKYLVGIEPEMTLRQLTLSIDLGESLLYIKGSARKECICSTPCSTRPHALASR